MPVSLMLPGSGGALEKFTLRDAVTWEKPAAPFRSRIAFAAAHVVCNPLLEFDASGLAPIDWDATLAYRRHLWAHGFAVAEAMDTAQRGGGLTWIAAQDLITRAMAEARAQGGRIACGAGTDHLPPSPDVTLDDVERAYLEQVSFVELNGGQVILMASRALARAARSPDDYQRVYDTVLRQATTPVIMHWLGDMFDPALAGYWGAPSVDGAMEVCLSVIAAHADKVDGIKISLLDARREVDMRRRLAPGVRMYTGDDFNYAELIAGDGTHHSDALLGIFDGIAPAASAALQALDAGDVARFNAILEPTVPLSRHIFRHPTFAYKTGIVFLAYLNGHQSHFRMLGGAESARSAVHLADVVRLADAAGLLRDPEMAAARAHIVMSAAGVT